MDVVFIGIGSNLNNPAIQCRRAVNALTQLDGVDRLDSSPWYRTEPFGDVIQGWYVNGVVRIETTLRPFQLLDACQDLENRTGRVRDVHWGPRPLDLDILLWRHRITVSSRLCLPHPRLLERRFVLLPMCAIAADEVHPLTGHTMQHHLDTLADPHAVELMDEQEIFHEESHRSRHSSS